MSNAATQQTKVTPFDDLLAALAKNSGKITSVEIDKVIQSLHKARCKMKDRESQKLIAAEQKKAKAAKEQYIQQITSMDLPLDWENLFAGDPAVAGVHADSIPDGLILSLANLGRVDIVVPEVKTEAKRTIGFAC